MSDDRCPECGARLEGFSICASTQLDIMLLRCPECYWQPGAVKVPCECGCGRRGFDARMEFNHPEDYRYERG